MIYINNTTVDKVFFKEQDISCYSKDVLIYPYTRPLILEFTTTASNQIIRIPISGINEVTIDYGDGSSLVTTTSNLPTHTYANAGKYEVKILGKFSSISSFNLNYVEKSYITNVINWGDSNIGITDIAYAFYECKNLINIPSDTYGAFKNVTSMDNIFNSCTLLSNIPSGLFDNCTKVTIFRNTFTSCTSLTTIPSGLFDKNVNVKHFYGTFGGCYRLTNIPIGLFDNCPNVTFFYTAFYGCTSLTSIPIGLFDKNTKVTNFSQTFNNCSGLTGTVPYDSLGGTQTPTPLYQRSTGVNGYAKVELYPLCFKDCTGLSDYSSIPSDWKQ